MGNICTSPKNNLRDSGRPNMEKNNLIVDYRNIDKWDVNDVYTWLSTIDDGVLCELAVKFKNARIRGKILENVTDTQLVEMDVALGDRMHFDKIRKDLFKKCNYHSNSNIPLSDNHSNPTSHISSNHSSHHSNENIGLTHHSLAGMSAEGLIPDDISNHQSTVASLKHTLQNPNAPPQWSQMAIHTQNRSVPLHFTHPNLGNGNGPSPVIRPYNLNQNIQYLPRTQLAPMTSSGSSHGNGNNFDAVEENQYAAVDGRLIEGIEEVIKVTEPLPALPVTSKPRLNKSMSADVYKQGPISINRSGNGVGPKSLSNPINPSRNNPMRKHKKLPAKLRMAAVLKHAMKNEVFTGQQIIDILYESVSDTTVGKDKYERFGQSLLTDQILRGHITTADTASDMTVFQKQNKYDFNASMFDNLMKLESLSMTTMNPRPTGMSNIHINAGHTFCGGQQVMVFSPKSTKWRNGIILNFDQKSNYGRICCYNSMGKQSMKDLSLPSPLVRPLTAEMKASKSHNPYQQRPKLHTVNAVSTSAYQPMQQTAAAWNNMYRDREQQMYQ